MLTWNAGQGGGARRVTRSLEQVWTHSQFVPNTRMNGQVTVPSLSLSFARCGGIQHDIFVDFKHQVGTVSEEVELEG
jgi:hypothetical protein